MKFYGGFQGCERNKRLDFGIGPDHHADFPFGNPTILNKLLRGNFEQWDKTNKQIAQLPG